MFLCTCAAVTTLELLCSVRRILPQVAERSEPLRQSRLSVSFYSLVLTVSSNRLPKHNQQIQQKGIVTQLQNLQYLQILQKLQNMNYAIYTK